MDEGSITVTADWPAAPPDAAWIGAVPGPMPRTNPSWTVAMSGSSLLHVTGRSERIFPASSRTVAWKRRVSPMATVTSDGDTVTECTSTPVTLVSLQEAAVKARMTPHVSRQRGKVTGSSSMGLILQGHARSRHVDG